MKFKYIFRNLTTGEEMVCNDLKFMVHQLRCAKELVVPKCVLYAFISKGDQEFEIERHTGEVVKCFLGLYSALEEQLDKYYGDPLVRGLYDGIDRPARGYRKS